MEDFLVVVGVLILLRITMLSTERVAFHGLGRGSYSPLATMGIAFWGASLILWGTAIEQHQGFWIGAAIWTGLVYALAFGLYTAALVAGPVGSVSAWTNLTIVLLWMVQPTGGTASIVGILVFIIGGIWLAGKRVSQSVVWIICSDVMFVLARTLDSHHTHFPPYAYAASLFTAISLWMTVAIIFAAKVSDTIQLFWARPGWSIAAASTNAGAYLTLFFLLHWLPPALVEAISALAAFVATLAGIIFFREKNVLQKLSASFIMTVGVLILLIDHYNLLHQLLN